MQSNGLTQHINSTTRNNDKTNSKFVSGAGSLEHFVSDHQPIYVIHKKRRDMRQSVKFEGRSYRNFNNEKFKDILLAHNWKEFYALSRVEEAWDYILSKIIEVLDLMCPFRSFDIRNYRPEWMTRELIKQVKDRD